MPKEDRVMPKGKRRIEKRTLRSQIVKAVAVEKDSQLGVGIPKSQNLIPGINQKVD